MPSTELEKLSEQINFSVTADLALQAAEVHQATGIRPTQIARAGFVMELQRLRAGIKTPVDVETLRLVSEAQRLNLDVRAVLKRELKRVA